MPVIHDLLAMTGLVTPETSPPRNLHHYQGKHEYGSSVTMSDGELEEEADRLHELPVNGKRNGRIYASGGRRTTLHDIPLGYFEPGGENRDMMALFGSTSMPPREPLLSKPSLNREKLGRLHEALESHPVRPEEVRAPMQSTGDHKRPATGGLDPGSSYSPVSSSKEPAICTSPDLSTPALSPSASTDTSGEYCFSGKPTAQMPSGQNDHDRRRAETPRWHMVVRDRDQRKELAHLGRSYFETRRASLMALIHGREDGNRLTKVR